MERNTCYLNLSVAEAARTVSELVERAGLSSRMVDCHELRQGENLCGMVLLFEKYFLRMGSRLTLTAVLDNLEGRTRLYWTVTGGRECSGRAETARQRRRSTARPCGRSCSPIWTAEGGREKMEDSYFVSLGLRECGETIHAAVTDSVTGELVDHYELTHPGGGTCVVAVYEKHYYRAGNRLTLTVVLDDFTGRTRVHCIGGGGGEGLFRFDWGRRSPSRESSTTR
ncbi:DUF6054 family protein [Flavonifractor plautii]|nr:DUF6054 family protein [Flavonifractor plautii]